MKTNTEFKKFNEAMGTILKADPATVKAQVDAEVRASVEERKAKGERKRGRKPTRPSASGHVSGGGD
jgi:hypothetical protein